MMFATQVQYGGWLVRLGFVALNGALLAAVALAIVAVQVIDRSASAVESSVRRYAVAVSTSDLDAAMAEIAPSARPAWRDWVSGQLGNVYEVRGIAVRAGALLGAPVEVTTVLDVNRGYPDEFYQPTTTVAVTEADGHFYLEAPLLAPPP